MKWWSGLFGGRNEDCGRKDCNLCQATRAMGMVATTRSSTWNNNAGLHWLQLFSLLSVFDCVVMESQCCLWKYYNVTMYTSPWKLLFFTSFLTQNNFFYFSFDVTYSIAFHTLVAPNIMFNFHWYCMFQSLSYVLRLLYHFYVFYRYSGCLAKIGNFNAEKKSHIAPDKNCLEPKIT